MNQLLFNRLSEKVKNCNTKEINDYDFHNCNFSEETFETAWFQIHEDQKYCYYISINENGKINMMRDDSKVCTITGENAENWKSLADEIFQDRYSERIERAKEESAHNNWIDFQDAKGEMQRYRY